MDCQAVELVVEVAADIDAVLLAEPALATRLGYPQDQYYYLLAQQVYSVAEV